MNGIVLPVSCIVWSLVLYAVGVWLLCMLSYRQLSSLSFHKPSIDP